MHDWLWSFDSVTWGVQMAKICWLVDLSQWVFVDVVCWNAEIQMSYMQKYKYCVVVILLVAKV